MTDAMMWFIGILIAGSSALSSYLGYRLARSKDEKAEGEYSGELGQKLEQCLELIQEVRNAQKEQAAFNNMILERIVRLEVTCELRNETERKTKND